MIILIIMGGFFPGRKFGGPPVSVDNFCSLMKGYAECFVVTHNHDMGEKQTYHSIHKGWNDRGNAKVLYLSDKDYAASSFEKVIKNIRPDFIYLQGLFQNCVIPCLWLAQKYRINTVLAPRGELCSGAFRKKFKKLPYLALLRMMGLLNKVHFQSTSEEETEAIARFLGAKSDRIHQLTNIPSIPTGLQEREIKKSGEARLVFISRILWKKNLLKAINYLKYVNGHVVFDIYGPKEDENYWNECEKAISLLPSSIKVEYKGVLNHENIHATFNRYDAFLFPTLSENYGHVIAEALVTGCIPIISDQTPWNDINEACAGWAIPLYNEEGFIAAIQAIVDMNDYVITMKRKSITSYLDRKLQLDKLTEEYQAVFNRRS